MQNDIDHLSSNLWLTKLPIVAVLSLAIVMPGLITALRHTMFSTATANRSVPRDIQAMLGRDKLHALQRATARNVSERIDTVVRAWVIKCQGGSNAENAMKQGPKAVADLEVSLPNVLRQSRERRVARIR